MKRKYTCIKHDQGIHGIYCKDRPKTLNVMSMNELKKALSLAYNEKGPFQVEDVTTAIKKLKKPTTP